MAADDVPISRPPAANPTSTILVADDDPDLLALMARRLVKGGYLVVTAADGQQAFELAARLLPDLALLDVMMPKLTGDQVAARLRADPSTRAIKIVLISAGFNAAGGEAMSGCGADGYIVKPFDRGEPVTKVGTVLAEGPTTSSSGGSAVVELWNVSSGASSAPPVAIGDGT